MKADFKMLIDGELVEGVSTFDVINPATEEAFAQCPKADEAMLNRAVAAAKAAFPGWSAKSVDERADYIIRLADAIEARTADFARLLTTEQGKPLDQATYEIVGASFEDAALEFADLVHEGEVELTDCQSGERRCFRIDLD